ncbi:IBB domain-containing protein [Caenorhabditis elegans]|uniref:IBB domain-containing protein n=1 Tax=Caenorhabditis elegans TaxID=6239 RepID=D7SFM2_CAEEL|nr:IBB domain-containing protein [Caenorhabditis elegans]CBM41198.1 IBB domain-containing protein [Caenorhabditis elegans]|eukprot:NP_001254148.1 Uncharacterized protein CELE_F14E5.8 [Caenorhabditis elegans]
MAKSKAEIQKEERDNRYERRLLEKRKRHEIDNKASTSSSMASAAPAPPMKNGRTRKQQKLQNLALAREKQRIKRAAAKHVRNNDNNQVDNEADRIDEGAANSDAGKIGLFQKTACNLAEHN